MLSRSLNESKMKVKKILDLSSIGVQCFGLLIWPLTVQSTSAKIWYLPIAALFISCHWWENYVSYSSPWEPVQFLAFIKDKCYESRYKIYALIAPYKILLFFCIATFMTDANLDNLQSSLSSDKSNHTIKIEELRASLNGRLPDFNDITNDLFRGEIKGHLTAVWWILFVHALSSYICYIFGKFACKIQIQTFSFAFPINLTVPLTVSMLIIFCGMRHMNPCSFHGILPDFIFFKMPPTDFLFGYIFKQFVWIWIFWLGAQTWVTRHLWKPKGMRNASTEKLFLLPTYDSLIIDQSMAMNRRRDEYEEFINHEVREIKF
jgi:chitin synthase